MKPWFAQNYDFVALGLALIALGVSLGWFCHIRVNASGISVQPAEVSVATDYQPPAPPLGSVEVKAWAKPTAQSSGGNWVYELFTPPVVFYDRLSGSFTVSPPLDSGQSPIEPFDVELIAVEKEPYRVQLAGYFGERGAYAVIFLGDGLSGPLIAREGGRIGDMGLRLRNFSIGRAAPLSTEGRAVDEVAAVAELFDERAGVAVMLDSRSRKFSGALLAKLQSTAFEGNSRMVRAGEEFSDSNYIFRVERIGDQPDEVVISRREAGAVATEVATLRLPAESPQLPIVVQADLTKHFPTRPATEFVTNK